MSFDVNDLVIYEGEFYYIVSINDDNTTLIDAHHGLTEVKEVHQYDLQSAPNIIIGPQPVVPQKEASPQSSKKAYYMSLVYMIATQSKDESSKLGAVIIGPDGEIRSTGYNGLPRGSQDDCPDRQQAPEKYFWFEHAERNAIYNAARMGTSLKDCVMYTQGTPCADCARAIIQAGIKKVIVHKQWNEQSSEKWADSAKRSKTLFKECLVTLEEWSGELTRPYSLQSGVRRDW